MSYFQALGSVAVGMCRVQKEARGRDATYVYKVVSPGTAPRWVRATAADIAACQSFYQPPAKTPTPCKEGARRYDKSRGKDEQSLCVDGQWVVVGTTSDRIDPKKAAEGIREQRAVGSMFSIVVFFGSLIWAFARYPDRQEFERVQEKQERKQETIEGDIDKIRVQQNEMRIEQTLIKDAVQRQEVTTKAIDQKIDVLVEKIR